MKRLVLAVVGCLCALAVPARGAPAMDSFTVQGILRDGSGALQSKSLTVFATLWNHETMTANPNKVIPTVGPVSATASNGLFSVVLQDAGLVAAIMTQSTDLWLELVVDSVTYPRTKVTPQVLSLVAQRAVTADGLNCTGCVSNSALAGSIDLAKVTGAQTALTSRTCTAGQFYSDISSGGVVTCAPAVTSAAPATSSGITIVAGGSAGSIVVGTDGTIQRAFTQCTLNGANLMSCSGCPAGSAMASVTSAGVFNCVNTVASADSLSANCAAANGGTGCVTTGQIRNGEVRNADLLNGGQHNHGLVQAIQGPSSTSVAVNEVKIFCQQCPAGQLAFAGNCNYASPNGGAIQLSGPNPLPAQAPPPTPGGSPGPFPTGSAWCCKALGPSGPSGATGEVNGMRCVGIADAQLP